MAAPRCVPDEDLAAAVHPSPPDGEDRRSWWGLLCTGSLRRAAPSLALPRRARQEEVDGGRVQLGAISPGLASTNPDPTRTSSTARKASPRAPRRYPGRPRRPRARVRDLGGVTPTRFMPPVPLPVPSRLLPGPSRRGAHWAQCPFRAGTGRFRPGTAQHRHHKSLKSRSPFPASSTPRSSACPRSGSTGAGLPRRRRWTRGSC